MLRQYFLRNRLTRDRNRPGFFIENFQINLDIRDHRAKIVEPLDEVAASRVEAARGVVEAYKQAVEMQAQTQPAALPHKGVGRL